MTIYEISVRDATGRAQTYEIQGTSEPDAVYNFRTSVNWAKRVMQSRLISCKPKDITTEFMA